MVTDRHQRGFHNLKSLNSTRRVFKLLFNVNKKVLFECDSGCERLTVPSVLCHTGAGSFGVFSCVLDGVERQQSHRAVYRSTLVSRHKINVHVTKSIDTSDWFFFSSWPGSRFVPRHADELYLETDDPVLMLNQSEDLWCQGYNMRTGAAGIFPAFYTVKVAKDVNPGTPHRAALYELRIAMNNNINNSQCFHLSFLLTVQKDGWTEQFLVRFLGSVQVPIHKGNDVLCAAMQKVHEHNWSMTSNNNLQLVVNLRIML